MVKFNRRLEYIAARCSSPSTAISASPSEIAVAKHATAQGATSKLFTKNLDIQRLTR